MTDLTNATRRTILAAGFSTAAAPAWAQQPSARRDVAFEVWRNNQKIGMHTVAFRGDDRNFTVSIDAAMLVKLGPVPVFRYHLQVSEAWRDGRFAAMDSTTVTNGHTEKVSAVRSASGVAITVGARPPQQVAAAYHPLTHWNAAVMDGPLFNPQTGAPMRERVSQADAQGLRLPDGAPASARFMLTGDAEITDWYDASGAWAALRAKATDGSWIDYRRV